ncbi:MAG: class I SAM-dependent methyltransferase [archaeon]
MPVSAEEVRDIYNRVAEAHHAKLLDLADSAWNAAERHAMLELIGDCSGKSVADIACGSGIITPELFRLGAARVAGIDFAEEQVRIAARGNPKALFAAGDALALPLASGEFDLAFSSYFIHYLKPEELAEHFKEVGRILKPGSAYHFSTDNPKYVDCLLGAEGKGSRTYDWEMNSKGTLLFKMTSYLHSPEELAIAARAGGFGPLSSSEPGPPEFLRELAPEYYGFASKVPTLIIWSAVKG